MTRNQTASQTVVVVAMGLVTAAAAVAMHQHAGMPGPVAATAALSAYLLLLTGHAFLWRRERTALKPAMPREARAAAPAMAPRNQDVKKAAPSMPMPPPLPSKAPGASAPPAPPFGTRVNPNLPPMPPQPPKAGPRQTERAAPPPLPASPPPRAASAPPQEDLQDLWSFRPATNAAPAASAPAVGQKLPPFVAARAPASGPVEPTLPGPGAQRGAAPAARPPAPPKASAPREADVEVIQDAIKRLLEEVNAAEQGRASAPAAQGNASAAAGAVPPPLPDPSAAAAHEASIERSIDALRMTAGSMRAAFGEEPAPQAAPATPPLPPFVRGAAPQAQSQSQGRGRSASAADARARLMADAISAGRIDVSLEPILGLEDQQTRHYEVSVRLRDADGNALDVSPDGPDLRGTGLLPLFDGVRVTRTAAVARRLEERGKGGSLFSAFSGESVADEHFLGELAETLHQRASLASQLVLSFTQSDVRGFSTPEWDSLADMRALGFRFAITHLTDLDMDFEALAEQGFVFAKLDAEVFLDGLRAPSGFLPSSDVCRHLARHGLTLVVEHIDNDEQLARVFGFGVLLGQGQLFGGARPVRADVVASRGPRGATVAA